MTHRECRTCYQYQDDHHAKFATSWDWCIEKKEFIRNGDGVCEKHRTFEEAVAEGLLIVVSKEESVDKHKKR